MRKEFDTSYIDEGENFKTIGFLNNEKNKSFIENIIFLEFKVSPGDKVTKGDELLSAESMKGTEELRSEIEGEIVNINTTVQENPELLKDKPEEWLLKIK